MPHLPPTYWLGLAAGVLLLALEFAILARLDGRRRAGTLLLCLALPLASACTLPAATAHVLGAGADAVTTVAGQGRPGVKEANPVGVVGTLAAKVALYWLAEQYGEPWRSRLHWIGAAVGFGAAVNNGIVLARH